MRYTARIPSKNHNISEESPLKDFILLLGGLLAACLMIFFLLGALLDIVVARLPPSAERALGRAFAGLYSDKPAYPLAEAHLQELVSRLAQGVPEQYRDLKVHLDPDDSTNAIAVPGGHIIVYKGLLTGAKSENEIAMVLGHEIGHFVNRDHLRGLGRGLVLVALSMFVLGNDSAISSALSSSLLTVQYSFSREQERAADKVGLDLLAKAYGHAGGATAFFERISNLSEDLPLEGYFSTHPVSSERVASIRARMRERRLLEGSLTPYTWQAR